MGNTNTHPDLSEYQPGDITEFQRMDARVDSAARNSPVYKAWRCACLYKIIVQNSTSAYLADSVIENWIEIQTQAMQNNERARLLRRGIYMATHDERYAEHDV